MLRIGKLTDYALLILSQMAKNPASHLSATALSEALNLSTPTVSKILKILAEAGLVTSIRGAVGGYMLNRIASDISIADVLTAMEGELALTECCELKNLCAIESTCTLRANWRLINKNIHAMLSKLNILDMAKPLAEGSFHVK